MQRSERAAEVTRRLNANLTPNPSPSTERGGNKGDLTPRTELVHRNAFELLIATILSAQCTDARVNQVTQTLFREYPTPQALAAADPALLEVMVRPTGFFRRKAAAIRGCAQALLAGHGGRVPGTMAALLTLPGVARKTANVVLANWFRRAEGIIVDVHVHRVANGLDLVRRTDPNKTEADLLRLFPARDWVWIGDALLLHGRYTCQARKPKCAQCKLENLCPKRGVIKSKETRK